MRRPTAIALIILLVLLAITAIVQFTRSPPDRPYPGPVPGTPLPPALTASPSP